jgi:hypothetical protein
MSVCQLNCPSPVVQFALLASAWPISHAILLLAAMLCSMKTSCSLLALVDVDVDTVWSSHPQGHATTCTVSKCSFATAADKAVQQERGGKALLNGCTFSATSPALLPPRTA